MNNNRVLLIEPPFYRLYKDNASLHRFPLSLAYLAGALKKDTDCEVMVYNADFKPINEPFENKYAAGIGFDNYLKNVKSSTAPIWREIEATIRNYSPAVVGISSKSQNFASASMVAQITKAIDKNIIVVVGGPHPSMVKTEVLKNENIDLGVVGEGEQTIVDIIKALGDLRPLDSIAGIVYRRDNEFVETPRRQLIADLDSLQFPIIIAPEVLKDFSLYPKEAFRFLFTIRGCPYNCSYCGSRYIWTRQVRVRSIKNILAEIRELDKAGVNSIHFYDDTFGVKKSHIKELCLAIQRNFPNLSWSCEMHVNLVDHDIISLMKNAGCSEIQLGIESGNNEILNKINKRITIEKSLTAARIIKKYNINLELFFMVGFPQETEATLNDTIKAMRTFPCDFLVYSIFTPYPGTEMFNYCKENGLIPPNFDLSLYNHQSPLNYFSHNIPQNTYFNILRKLEKEIDRINASKELKRYFSLQGYDKLKEKGLNYTVSRFVKFIRNMVN